MFINMFWNIELSSKSGDITRHIILNFMYMDNLHFCFHVLHAYVALGRRISIISVIISCWCNVTRPGVLIWQC